MDQLFWWTIVAIGVMGGFTLGWLAHRPKHGESALTHLALEKELQFTREQLAEWKPLAQSLQQQVTQITSERDRLTGELSALRADHQAWVENLEQQWQQQFQAYLLTQVDAAKTSVSEKASDEYKEKQTLLDTQLKTLLKPLFDTIDGYKKQVGEFEKTHQDHTTMIREEMRRLAEVNRKLESALSHNKGRGDWGELELIRLLEDSGLVEGHGYVKQTVVGQERKRPDIRINLCDGRAIFVDAKALQVDLTDLGDESSPEVQKARQERYLKSLNQAVDLLSSKDYQAEVQAAANFVVLYVPRESMLALAFAADGNLFERAYQKNIILAGPFNMMGLLKLVHHGWVMAQLSEQASQIVTIGTELKQKGVLFAERFNQLGKDIDKLGKSFSDVKTTFDGRGGFLQKLKKMEELGCKGKSAPEEIHQPEPLSLGDIQLAADEEESSLTDTLSGYRQAQKITR